MIVALAQPDLRFSSAATPAVSRKRDEARTALPTQSTVAPAVGANCGRSASNTRAATATGITGSPKTQRQPSESTMRPLTKGAKADAPDANAVQKPTIQGMRARGTEDVSSASESTVIIVSPTPARNLPAISSHGPAPAPAGANALARAPAA